MKINLLPGPVHISEDVKQHFGRVPVSHRGQNFLDDLSRVKAMFRAITRCKNVEICLGSGTLANDLVAAQLSLINKKGLVLSNGEFGSRLIDHARRFRLNFEKISLAWGKAFDYSRVEKILLSGQYSWIWFVHHETSTGMLNDFEKIKLIARKNNVLLCADCISSICAVPLDLSGVAFASGTSGKAIGSYPGLSFVFYEKLFSSRSDDVPRYLDLRLYKKHEGIPFTSSSNLLSALKNALSGFLLDAMRFENIRRQTEWFRKKLSSIRVPVLVEGPYASPIITTLILPKRVNTDSLGKRLQEAGFHVHYNSGYLKKKNWIQVSSMSVYDTQRLAPLFDMIQKAVEP